MARCHVGEIPTFCSWVLGIVARSIMKPLQLLSVQIPVYRATKWNQFSVHLALQIPTYQNITIFLNRPRRRTDAATWPGWSHWVSKLEYQRWIHFSFPVTIQLRNLLSYEFSNSWQQTSTHLSASSRLTAAEAQLMQMLNYGALRRAQLGWQAQSTSTVFKS